MAEKDYSPDAMAVADGIRLAKEREKAESDRKNGPCCLGCGGLVVAGVLGGWVGGSLGGWIGGILGTIFIVAALVWYAAIQNSS